jgi:hypothetical protein
MKTLTFLLIVLLTSSCMGRRGTATGDGAAETPVVYDIVLEESLGDKREFKLSDIAESLEYVELKTPPGMPIMVNNFAVSEDYIFAESRAEVFQFTMSGEFVRRVGRRGRGPGEYLSAMDIVVDENNKRVSIMSYPAIGHYSFDGVFLGSEEIYTFDDYLIVSDSLIYASSIPFGYHTHKLVMLNNRRDTLSCIPNSNTYDMNGQFSLRMRFREPFYKHNDQIYFKGYADNDTIWLMKGIEYATHAVIDMGKFKSPEPTNGLEFEKWWDENWGQKEGDFYQVKKTQEDDGYIYLTCEPYWNPDMGSPRVIFDKAAGTGFSAVTAAGDAGMEDDILHGPTFWPEIITEDRYISVVEAYKLLEATEGATDLTPEFKAFLDGIDENTNTIVVMAKRKK